MHQAVAVTRKGFQKFWADLTVAQRETVNRIVDVSSREGSCRFELAPAPYVGQSSQGQFVLSRQSMALGFDLFTLNKDGSFS